MDYFNRTDLLDCIASLACSKSAQESLVRLKIYLAKYMQLEELVVLSMQRKSHWVTLASTHEAVVEHQWHMGTLFEAALEKHIVTTDNLSKTLEWRMLDVPWNPQKAIIMSLNFAEYKGLFIFLMAQSCNLDNAIQANMLDISALFKHALVQLEQQHKANQLIKERTYALTVSQQRLQAFAELASDWFWETDSELHYRYLSNHQNSFDEDFSNFIGQTPLQVRSQKEQIQLKKWGHFLHLVNHRKEIHNFEYEAMDGKGNTFWLSISGKANLDESGEFLGYFGIGRDITFAKQREIDLSHAKEKAESASVAKSHFLAVMSHEIRTPMNAIIGVLELLEDICTTEKQLELIEFMRHSTHLLQGVITDSLDFAKIEAGKMTLDETRINLHRLLQNIAQQFETQSIKQGINFDYLCGDDVPEHILCDDVRLSQVILNLLGNAFKFTKKGFVKLSVNRQNDNLLVQVIDSGTGIAANEVSELFEPFTQCVSDVKARQQGVGLGLSIAKRLLNLMHGDIKCHSEMGVGTEFVVTLPIQRIVEDNGAAELSQQIQSNKQSFNILVAEDNIANQFVIKAILEKRNHHVTIVENGKLAVEAAMENNYDLILMDMMMPEMDGITAAKKIKEMKIQTPIIALTANAGVDDKKRCLAAGMHDVLTKPLDSSVLDKKISSLNQKV